MKVNGYILAPRCFNTVFSRFSLHYYFRYLNHIPRITEIELSNIGLLCRYNLAFIKEINTINFMQRSLSESQIKTDETDFTDDIESRNKP